jgi:hypothetical protein
MINGAMRLPEELCCLTGETGAHRRQWRLGKARSVRRYLTYRRCDLVRAERLFHHEVIWKASSHVSCSARDKKSWYALKLANRLYSVDSGARSELDVGRNEVWEPKGCSVYCCFDAAGMIEGCAAAIPQRILDAHSNERLVFDYEGVHSRSPGIERERSVSQPPRPKG